MARESETCMFMYLYEKEMGLGCVGGRSPKERNKQQEMDRFMFISPSLSFHMKST